MKGYISLNRQFSLVPKNEEEAEKDESLAFWGDGKLENWGDIESDFRCVILAEAGAGKTEELRHRANVLEVQGKRSFFIRIEDIEVDFYNAFEIGNEEQFQAWLQSTEEAWFFLDSVDEARIEKPRTFEKAMRWFAKGIAEGAHRAHIYLSSRPYAWRPMEDKRLLDEILFIAAEQEEDEAVRQSPPPSALKVCTMRPLDKDRIRRFCMNRSAKDVDRLLQEIERANLWSLAERPFDLEGILTKWADDNSLDGRLELLRYNITKRLRDDHSTDRSQRQPLNIEQANEGARRLAAAVVLSGKAGLNVPDSASTKPGIEAESVLNDWHPKDVRALLERGVFNDIIYGAVRFRHRDVRELLAAEWFEGLLKSGNSRHSIEALFFREQYGEKIIAPRLRPILPWLILFDSEIRRKALAIHPEIALEGGEPSRLPLVERKRILADVVKRIVSDKYNHSARDNNAIARIANPDLSGEAHKLVNAYSDNDDAIFFLGRLVWQGEMINCVEPFIGIALDNTRGIYARRVSVRAVMTCGSEEQKQLLWQKLNESNAEIPRDVLEELVEEAEPNEHNIKHLLTSLGKLPPYKRFKVTGFGRSLNNFVERLTFSNDWQAITQFLDGLYTYLETPPYVERRECHVSKEFAWLLNTAIKVVEKLVTERSPIAFEKTVLSTMIMVPALRSWCGNDYEEDKNNLHKLIPDWPELNDALYWASIELARATKDKKSGEPLVDDWSVSWLGHFWKFNTDSLPRLLEYIHSRELYDDRLVALSTAFRVYTQIDSPAHVLSNLQDAVADEQSLKHQLDTLLKPPISETMKRHNEEHAEYERKCRETEEKEKKARESWISELQANPDRVRTPPNLKPGDFTDYQYCLMIELQNCNSKAGRTKYANWQALIPSFGKAVAQTYRNAAVNHWRHYSPKLRSEGAEGNRTPYSLIFGMAGLEIEASENKEFIVNLDEVQVRHALRYITWELNGFPSWLESMYQAFPELVEEAVAKELLWELENTESDKPLHYILHDLVYYAPWLHRSIAPLIVKWVEANPPHININRNYCLHIIVNGGTSTTKLTELATQQIVLTNDPKNISWWYALFVDCVPDRGIPEFEKWMSGLDVETATNAAQIFITALMGSRHANDGWPSCGNFKEAKHLKSLYVLMHKYIKAKEDIDHTGGEVYSPGLRDDSQYARNRLFNLITEIPGKESYTVIKKLVHEHPDPNYRPWMMEQAYKRAEEDGDLESWSAEQVNIFNNSQTITPVTHRQLFDLAIHRLTDLKNWLERGNDSPFQTWQRVSEETEMRTLIAGWLNQNCREQYTTAQEAELANSQRMDIWLHNTRVHSPVPIELKLLDKDWSGPKLCERLRNQLAGDYLREESAGCGVMLLVWQGKSPDKRWEIGGQRVGLDELKNVLKLYWLSIADQYPGVAEIEVVVIDLTLRAKVSDS